MQHAGAWHALFQQAVALLRSERLSFQFFVVMSALIVIGFILHAIAELFAKPLRARREAALADDELPPMAITKSAKPKSAPVPAKRVLAKPMRPRKRATAKLRKTKTPRPTITHRADASLPAKPVIASVRPLPKAVAADEPLLLVPANGAVPQ